MPIATLASEFCPPGTAPGEAPPSASPHAQRSTVAHSKRLHMSDDLEARLASQELAPEQTKARFRPSVVSKHSERRGRSSTGQHPSPPRFYAPTFSRPEEDETVREGQSGPKKSVKPLKYIGCPPLDPRLRPKRTCAGLKEKMRATGYTVSVNWDLYAGYHAHAVPPEVDAMHAEEVLTCVDPPEVSRDISCSHVKEGQRRVQASSLRNHPGPSKDSPALSQRTRSVSAHCGLTRHCIPVYQFAPTLCTKSREIIDSYREHRVASLWTGLDLANEGVVDFLQLPRGFSANSELYVHTSSPGGTDARRPVMTRVEERFLRACIPHLIAGAVSRSSARILKDGGTLGPRFDPALRLYSSGPGGSADGTGNVHPVVTVATEPPTYPYPRPTDPMRVDLLPDAEAEAARAARETSEAARACRRLAKEHNQVVMLNVDESVEGGAEASAQPMLFVPRRKFIQTAVRLLAHEFGNSGVDSFRDQIMYECRRFVERVNPEDARKLFKPHILEYSRKLDARRRKKEREAHEEDDVSGRGRSYDRGVPGEGKDLTDASAFFGALYEAKAKFPRVGLRRVENRFDEQIDHYLRKKHQLQHLKQCLADMREGEFCTFHPEITPLPKYLRDRQRSSYDRPPPNDPMIILKQFCRHYTEDRNYAQLVETIRECTFQPNIEKFISKERQRKGAGVTKRSAGGRSESQPAVSRRKGDRSPFSGGEQEPGPKSSGPNDEEAKQSAGKRVDKLFDTLDEPFDYIFDADIRQWLASDGDRYCRSDEDQKETTGKRTPGWKRWEAEGREPQYRGPRKDRIEEKILSCEGSELVVETKERADGPSPSKKTPRRTTPYNEWVDSLRGGYLSNTMEFNLGPSEKGDREKLERYGMRDWSRYIRLKQREVETRVVPNDEIIDAVCESELPSAEPPPPTVWVHRRRWQPPLERGPGVSTHTEAHLHTTKESREGRLYPASGKPAGLTRQQAKAYRNPFPPVADATTFLVPTPMKVDKLRQKYRLYMQLRDGVDTGEIRIPPRVRALKRDVLKDLEDQVNREPPAIVLAEMRRQPSITSTAETAGSGVQPDTTEE